MKITVAESCTGGLLAAILTSQAGASEFFDRGLVAYSNQAKMEMLGVKAETLEQFGAVSEQTAQEMAQGALQAARADIAVSITGIAGPDGGTAEKPVGTVCFGLANAEGIQVFTQCFSGDRVAVRQQSVDFALSLLPTNL